MFMSVTFNQPGDHISSHRLIGVLTYRVLHGNAPRYLGPLTSTVDVRGRRTLRSAGTVISLVFGIISGKSLKLLPPYVS